MAKKKKLRRRMRAKSRRAMAIPSTDFTAVPYIARSGKKYRSAQHAAKKYASKRPRGRSKRKTVFFRMPRL